MRDAAEMIAAVTTARLNRELDERECKQRNALSQTSPGLVLRAGEVGTVVETFGPGEAFLVEFVNVQPDAEGNVANHIHSVWRDFAGDFGLDLLAQHYQADHR